MKSFYQPSRIPAEGSTVAGTAPARDVSPSERDLPAPIGRRARIAVYDSPVAAPRTVDVERVSEPELIEEIAAATYAAARELGGEIPYTVIREVSENFIHADFREPVVSILDGGKTIRFADQGPGIPDKDRAALPGFTTASFSMKSVIRGVGSGLPIVKEYLGHTGGYLEIDDNLGTGAVITVHASVAAEQAPEVRDPAPPSPPPSPAGDGELGGLDQTVAFPPLTTRQKHVLSLVLEMGEVGPTVVSKELSIALSTAHRDLAFLEEQRLISSDVNGKRVLTVEGASYLDGLFSL